MSGLRIVEARKCVSNTKSWVIVEANVHSPQKCVLSTADSATASRDKTDWGCVEVTENQNGESIKLRSVFEILETEPDDGILVLL